MRRSLIERVKESLLGVSAGGSVAVARGAETVLLFLRVLDVFERLLFFAVDLDEYDFLVDLFLLFFLAAETWVVSKISLWKISGRPSQSQMPKEIAPAANRVMYLFEFIICKITKNSAVSQL